jgi:hypothetical protein
MAPRDNLTVVMALSLCASGASTIKIKGLAGSVADIISPTPLGLAIDENDIIYVADSSTVHRIFPVSLTGNVYIFAGGSGSGFRNVIGTQALSIILKALRSIPKDSCT